MKKKFYKDAIRLIKENLDILEDKAVSEQLKDPIVENILTEAIILAYAKGISRKKIRKIFKTYKY